MLLGTNRVKGVLIRIWNAVYEKAMHIMYKVRIIDTEDTIDYILEKHCAVARFGDGELSMALGEEWNIGFQHSSKDLAAKLREVLNRRDKRVLVCIPRYIETLKGCTPQCRAYWTSWKTNNKKLQRVVRMLRKECGWFYTYGDALISRPYMDCKNVDKAEQVFESLKRIWKDKQLVIVEGENTCLGVGNDLFSEAKTIERIIAPSKHAFDYYEVIKREIVKHCNESNVVLIALGPTATVLASELVDERIYAIDIGHIDIEYEWMRMRATHKVAVPGKYTNEAANGEVFEQCNDQEYLSQIVVRIQTGE